MTSWRQILEADQAAGDPFRTGGGYYQILLEEFSAGDPWVLQAVRFEYGAVASAELALVSGAAGVVADAAITGASYDSDRPLEVAAGGQYRIFARVASGQRLRMAGVRLEAYAGSDLLFTLSDWELRLAATGGYDYYVWRGEEARGSAAAVYLTTGWELRLMADLLGEWVPTGDMLTADGLINFRASFLAYWRLTGGAVGAVAHVAPIYRYQPDDR